MLLLTLRIYGGYNIRKNNEGETLVMKKNVIKILATASACIAVVLTIILIVTAFGGIGMEEYDNTLVKWLITTMGIVYIISAALTLTMLFTNDETIKEIVLANGKEGSTRATLGVVKKIAKENCVAIEGVKFRKCAIAVNDYGVKLRVVVSINDSDVPATTRHLRAVLEDAYEGALGFKFFSVDIKVKKLKSKYKPDVASVISKSDEEAVIEAERKAALGDGQNEVSLTETADGTENANSEPTAETEQTAETEITEQGAEEVVSEEKNENEESAENPETATDEEEREEKTEK